MDTPVYRVTEKKIEGYFGKSVKSYLNPHKGKGSLKFISGTGFIIIIFLLMAALALGKSLVLKTTAGFVAIIIGSFITILEIRK